MIKIEYSKKLARIIQLSLCEQLNQFHSQTTSNQGSSIDVLQYIKKEYFDSTNPAVRNIIDEIDKFDVEYDALKYAKTLKPTTRCIIRLMIQAL